MEKKLNYIREGFVAGFKYAHNASGKPFDAIENSTPR